MPVTPVLPNLTVRPLGESEIPEAERIFRLAFATFVGAPDQARISEGRDMIGSRWRADPRGVLAAELEGRLAGSNIATTWGSFSFFGPLTVAPEHWDAGIGAALVGATMELFEARGTRYQGLYTFANSPKHFGLYRKFGFWPRFLTALLTRPASAPLVPSAADLLSALRPERREEALRASFDLTDSLLDGFDVRPEMASVLRQGIGESVLTWGASRLEGLAVCHFGAGSEAAPRGCYVKFAAVRTGNGSEAAFERLLDAIDRLAAERGLDSLEAGVNLAHERAYSVMARRGFRIQSMGVAMQRPNAEGYKRPSHYVLDDWR